MSFGVCRKTKDNIETLIFQSITVNIQNKNNNKQDILGD